MNNKERILKAARGEMVDKGMLPAMEVIGAKFRDGTVFIPEVLKSARAMISSP